ncbi:MAG: hypothetical protein JWM16_2990, partial [Verrucomicrobiales bacterium]|nr:hypothetical protein [Verrucomicrobiales bacterium]
MLRDFPVRIRLTAGRTAFLANPPIAKALRVDLSVADSRARWIPLHCAVLRDLSVSVPESIIAGLTALG